MTTGRRTRVRSGAVTALAVAAAIAAGAGVSAHRLDEYLQATRLDIRPDGVRLALELTPGAAVADAIVTRIDRDGDHLFSPAEQRAYASDVVASLNVVVDGTPVALQLETSTFPALETFRRGDGTIRLQVRGSSEAVASGRHHLSFMNGHASRESVYMANALVPEVAGIVIGMQRHSPDQRQLSLDYDVGRPSSTRTSSLVMAGCVAAVLLVRAARGRVFRLSPSRR